MRKLLIILALFHSLIFISVSSTATDSDLTISPQLIEADNLKAFLTILNIVKQKYVEEVDEKKLVEAALNGMLESLDPNSMYLNEEEWKDFMERLNAEFGGLGIEFAFDGGGIKVIAPIEDTPAYRVGINSGDLIIAIDDKNVADMTRIDAVKKMRGKPGSKIKLTVFREGETKPLEFNLTRELIKVSTVKYAYKDNIGYIRVLSFSKNTTEVFIKAYKEIVQSNNNLRGLIIDIRSNGGGLFDQAIELSSLFIENGNIVSVKGRDSEETFPTVSEGKTLVGDLSVVVLIDKGSASSSEIFAGALQDHGKAVIMGTKSYGKGTVQLTMHKELPSHYGAFKLTGAYFYTPKGHKIQSVGITPDIEVELIQNNRLLDDDQKSKNLRDEKNNVSGKKINDHLWNKFLEHDNVLLRAFDLIKGIEVFETK